MTKETKKSDCCGAGIKQCRCMNSKPKCLKCGKECQAVSEKVKCENYFYGSHVCGTLCEDNQKDFKYKCKVCKRQSDIVNFDPCPFCQPQKEVKEELLLHQCEFCLKMVNRFHSHQKEVKEECKSCGACDARMTPNQFQESEPPFESQPQDEGKYLLEAWEEKFCDIACLYYNRWHQDNTPCGKNHKVESEFKFIKELLGAQKRKIYEDLKKLETWYCYDAMAPGYLAKEIVKYFNPKPND